MNTITILCDNLEMRPGVEGSAAKDLTCTVNLLTFLKMAPFFSLDFNPRRPSLKKHVKEMIASLNEHPGDWGRDHPGIGLAVYDLYKGTQAGSARLSLPANIHLFNGGHSTLAIILYALAKTGVHVKNPTWEEVLAVTKDKWSKTCQSDFSEMASVRIPLHIYYPASSDPHDTSAFTAELHRIAKNANTSVALTAHGVAEASGVFDPVKKVAKTPIPLVWYDSRDTADTYARSICCSVIGMLMWTLQRDLPDYRKRTGLTLTTTQCIFSPGRCTDVYRATVELHGVAGSVRNEVTDSNVASLIAILPDFLEGYDYVGKWFTHLFDAADPRKHKYERLFSGSPLLPAGNKQCPFGYVETSERIVPRSMVTLVAYGFTSLIVYNEKAKKFEWAVRPKELFENKGYLDELTVQLKPLMRGLRELIGTRSPGSVGRSLRGKEVLHKLALASVDNVRRILCAGKKR